MDSIRKQNHAAVFTTKKGTAKTGLGLSITNDIVKAHGGSLDVTSFSPEKTIFTITLNE